jgi:ATP-dependent protease ClpP protease subunit
MPHTTLAAPSRLKRWPMNSLAAGQAEILIYEEIGYWNTSKMFVDQLTALGNVDVLDVRINSVGGLATEGVAMYQALARHPAQKRVWIDAAAYSAASLIAMAASPGELRIAFNARMMIHNAWNIILGDKRDMAKEAGLLDMLDGTIAATYAKRMAGSTKEEILALMADETWYDAEGAVAAGLADEVFDATEAELPADAANVLRQYKHVPRDLLTRFAERSATTLPADAVDAEQAQAVAVLARWAAVRERQAT